MHKFKPFSWKQDFSGPNDVLLHFVATKCSKTSMCTSRLSLAWLYDFVTNIPI